MWSQLSVFFGFQQTRKPSIPIEPLDGVISEAQIETSLTNLCSLGPLQAGSAGQRFSDLSVVRVAGVLKLLDKRHDRYASKLWADLPRTYIILRNVGGLECMDKFLQQRYSDIHLPYDNRTLPRFVGNESMRQRFLEFQTYLLTDAKDLEKSTSEGRTHLHLEGSGDIYFRRIRPLGRGGFGEVDEVLSNLSHDRFARKQVHRSRWTADSKSNRRGEEDIVKELKELKSLRHRHLVKIYGSYTDRHCIAFLMKPVAESNLEEFLKKPSPLTEGDRHDVRTFYGCLASAVHYLHQQNIRHRDLSSRNVLIAEGRVYISDLGAAYKWPGALGSVTHHNNVPYSDEYMAPEVARKKPRSSSSDMWSLGVVFLEMTTLLLGRTLQEMQDLLKQSAEARGLEPFVWANPQFVNTWATKLLKSNAKGDSHDNEPLEWVTYLLDKRPENRPKSQSLLKDVLESASSTIFCCFKCQSDYRDYGLENVPDLAEPQISFEDSDAVKQHVAELLGEDRSQHLPLSVERDSSINQWLSGTNIDTDNRIADSGRSFLRDPQIQERTEPLTYTYSYQSVGKSRSPINSSSPYVRRLLHPVQTVDTIAEGSDSDPEASHTVLDFKSRTLPGAFPEEPPPEPITPSAVEMQHKRVRDTGLGFLEYDSSSDEEPFPCEGNNMRLFNEIEDSSGSESSSEYSDETVLPDRTVRARSAAVTSSGTSGDFLDALKELPEDQDGEEVETAETKGPSMGLQKVETLALSLAGQSEASKQQTPGIVNFSKSSALAEYTANGIDTGYIAEGQRCDSYGQTQRHHIDWEKSHAPDESVLSYTGKEVVDQVLDRDKTDGGVRLASIASGGRPAEAPQDDFLSESEEHATATLKESPPMYAENLASLDPGNRDMSIVAENPRPTDVFMPEADVTLQSESTSPDTGWQDSAQEETHVLNAVDVTAQECVKESENLEDGVDDGPELAASAQDKEPVTAVYGSGGPNLGYEKQSVDDIVEVRPNDETQAASRSSEPQSDVPADLSGREKRPKRKTNQKRGVKPSQNPKEQHTKLTATNVEALEQGATLTPRPRRQKNRVPIPKINVNQYMDDAWEAASSVATSVMTERTTSLIRKASINKWNDKSGRYLEYFCKEGKSQAVRALLAQGCNPGRPRRSRKGPIMIAIKGASEKHNKCVRALIESGVDVNVIAPYHGKTPLHNAIENPNFKGYAKLIRELIEAGADSNQADLAGNYPLLKVFYGNETGPLEAHRRDALALLLRREEPATLVNIAQPGTLNTPLHLAARRKDVIAVGLLLHRKADVNAKNASGLTPLLVTTKQLRRPLAPDHISLIDLLLSTKGIKVDEKAGVDQQTALHQAVKVGIWEVVEQLLQHGADPRCTDKAGQDALSLATRHAHEHTEEDHVQVIYALNEALSDPWAVASET